MKHDVLKERLDEAGGIQAKYITLEAQYNALALLVQDSDSSAAVKVNTRKVCNYLCMLFLFGFVCHMINLGF